MDIVSNAPIPVLPFGGVDPIRIGLGAGSLLILSKDLAPLGWMALLGLGLTFLLPKSGGLFL